MTKRVINIGKGTGQDQFVRVEDKSGCVKFNDFLLSKIDATKKMIILAGGGFGGKKADHTDTGAGNGGGSGKTNGSGIAAGNGVQGVKGVTPSSTHHCKTFAEIMNRLLARLDKLLHPKEKRVPKQRSDEYKAAHAAALQREKEIQARIAEINEQIRKGIWNPYLTNPDYRGGVDDLRALALAAGFRRADRDELTFDILTILLGL